MRSSNPSRPGPTENDSRSLFDKSSGVARPGDDSGLAAAGYTVALPGSLNRGAASPVGAVADRAGTAPPAPWISTLLPALRFGVTLTSACALALLLLLLLGTAAPLTAAPPVAVTPAAAGFSVPQPGRVFDFPRDHGSHPDFRIEWWYLTGHLRTNAGARYGFQATFFRQSAPDRSTQIYLAHMAVTDLPRGRFLHQERLNCEGWDAAASTETLDLRNGPWTLRLLPGEPETLQLRGSVGSDAAFALTLKSTKPLVFFGEDGVSRKGSDPDAASHYLTFSRLAVTGTLAFGDEAPLAVTGEAWMDHEISSSQLSAGQVGWDWVSIQFSDSSRELMLYRLRRADGTADPASTLQWVLPDGRTRKAPFAWEPLDTWTSPETGAVYPSRIRLTADDPETGKPRVLIVVPLLRSQEITGALAGIAYWEGACTVLDAEGRTVGEAYMELTGYARPLDIP